jgi:succinate dehydrogenase/fumarate reductase flavoprotein subunit
MKIPLMQVAVATILFLGVSTMAQSPQTNSSQNPTALTQHAAGSFEVKMTPLDSVFQGDDRSLGRMTFDKQIHGDLEATSKGEMLTAGGPAKGSGGYVAIERVAGTLRGRAGTFVLQHSGTMEQKAFQLHVAVVPDSGTGQLTGLRGEFQIIITPDGKHTYEFAYTLPEAH